MIILRQGVACRETGQTVLSGMSAEQAASSITGEETGAAFVEMVRGPRG